MQPGLNLYYIFLVLNISKIFYVFCLIEPNTFDLFDFMFIYKIKEQIYFFVSKL